MAENEPVKEKHDFIQKNKWRVDFQLPAKCKDHKPAFWERSKDFTACGTNIWAVLT